MPSGIAHPWCLLPISVGSRTNEDRANDILSAVERGDDTRVNYFLGTVLFMLILQDETSPICVSNPLR